jgi:hypothetical protein
MQCGQCRKENENDAMFCEHCGSSLKETPAEKRAWFRGPYRSASLLLLAVAVTAGIGYYKYVLPGGIAAEVNGETITLAELDGVVRSAVPAASAGQMRYAVLSRLVTERIAAQEAAKAGVRVFSEELADALTRAQAASGMDRGRFEAEISGRYGSMRAFRGALERQLTIRKFITERLAVGIADPTIVEGRVDQWLREITGRAAVRIALEEQLPAGGCACCGGKTSEGTAAQGCDPSRKPAAGTVGASVPENEARKAALAYWRERHGEDPVELQVTDFGCHQQVDLLKGRNIAKSLRYQNGFITEL